MKIITLIICIAGNILFSEDSFGQEIGFTYDACGNMISRITIEDELKSALDDSVPAIRQYLNEATGNHCSEDQISVYPNPTTSHVNIICSNCPVDINLSMFLFSSNGELLQRITYKGNQYTIDVSGYPNGTYYLKTRIGKTIKSWKITKY